jgi:hypothetical protein
LTRFPKTAVLAFMGRFPIKKASGLKKAKPWTIEELLNFDIWVSGDFPGIGLDSGNPRRILWAHCGVTAAHEAHNLEIRVQLPAEQLPESRLVAPRLSRQEIVGFFFLFSPCINKSQRYIVDNQ